MDYVALGRQIRTIRQQRGLTQAKLAEKVAISTSFVGHIERGTRVISLATLLRVCEALEVTPNDLIYPYFLPPVKSNCPPGITAKQLAALFQYACDLVQTGE